MLYVNCKTKKKDDHPDCVSGSSIVTLLVDLMIIILEAEAKHSKNAFVWWFVCSEQTMSKPFFWEMIVQRARIKEFQETSSEKIYEHLRLNNFTVPLLHCMSGGVLRPGSNCNGASCCKNPWTTFHSQHVQLEQCWATKPSYNMIQKQNHRSNTLLGWIFLRFLLLWDSRSHKNFISIYSTLQHLKTSWFQYKETS